jgi:hypothetical protein
MRWTGNIARVGERRGAYRVLWGNVREGDRLEDIDIDEMVILKRIFKKWVGTLIGYIWLSIGTGGELL